MVPIDAVRPARNRSDHAMPSQLDAGSLASGSTSSSSQEGMAESARNTRVAASSRERRDEDRSLCGLSSFADLDHALGGVAASTFRGSLPTGIAVPSTSPPAPIADSTPDVLLERDGARRGKAASDVALSSRSRRVSSSSAGPATTPRRTGVCKFFNAQKGFGFVLDDAPEELGDVEVFVHYTAISSVKGGPNGFRSLLEVEYSIVQGPKGWQAQEVTGPSGAPCIGSPPNGAGTSSLEKAKQLDGRRRAESGVPSSRRASLLPSEETDARASRPRPKSKSRSLGETQAYDGLTYASDVGPGSVSQNQYRPTPEGYRQVLFHPYAQPPAPQQCFVEGALAPGPDPLYEAYAYSAYEAHREPRPSQMISPPPSLYAASHGGLVIPLPAFASSPTQPHLTSYAPVYSPFSLAPSPAAYFYTTSHDPYCHYSPYGTAAGLSLESEPQPYPISSNSPG
ncbi:hypothetical protein JCM3774_006195 [Rhodotorula dairenensis]